MTIFLAAAVVAVPIAIALFLLAPRKGRTEAHQQIAWPLLTGAVVALSLVPTQFSMQKVLRSSDAHDAQRARAEERRDRRRDQRQQLIQQINFSRDLRSIDLHGKDLHGLSLTRRNMRHADLASANLKGADLSYTDLRHANLENANLEDARLAYVRLDHTELKQANLSRADLRHARIRDAAITETRFDGAYMSHATLRSRSMEFSGYNSFIATKLIRTDLRGVRFDHSSFDRAYLYKVDLREAILSDSSFRNAVIYQSNAAGANLCHARLDRARIAGSTLLLTNLLASSWIGAYITADSTLAGADMRNAVVDRLRVVTRLSSLPHDLGDFAITTRGYPVELVMYRAAASPNAVRGGPMLRRYGADPWTPLDGAADACYRLLSIGKKLASPRTRAPRHDLLHVASAEGLRTTITDTVAKHFAGKAFAGYVIADTCVRASRAMAKYCLARSRLLAGLPRDYRWSNHGGRVRRVSTRNSINDVRLGEPHDIGNASSPFPVWGAAHCAQVEKKVDDALSGVPPEARSYRLPDEVLLKLREHAERCDGP